MIVSGVVFLLLTAAIAAWARRVRDQLRSSGRPDRSLRVCGAMPEVRNGDVTLHVEVDGAGEPVTVFAHGLTNSCRELAPFTPSLAGTAVRFCFRGHGHSSAPERGYRFEDLASDLDGGCARLRRAQRGRHLPRSRRDHVALGTRSGSLRPDRDAAACFARPAVPEPRAVRRDRRPPGVISEGRGDRAGPRDGPRAVPAGAVAPGAGSVALAGHEPGRGRSGDPRGHA